MVMLEALAASGFLDGLVRRLQRQWSALPPNELDECIAQAVDAAFAAVSSGTTVRDLGAWLWKTAQNKAQDRWQSEYAVRSPDASALDGHTAPDPEHEAERARRDQREDATRAEAIRIARELIPRIGDGQIVDVMELVIDAAAQRLPDLPAASIGESLGISEGAARKLVSRGLKRLRREAERAGVTMPTDIPETQMTDEGEETW